MYVCVCFFLGGGGGKLRLKAGLNKMCKNTTPLNFLSYVINPTSLYNIPPLTSLRLHAQCIINEAFNSSAILLVR